MGILDLFIKPSEPVVRVPPAVTPPPRAPTVPTASSTSPADTSAPIPPPRFRDAVDEAFAEAASPHLSVYLSLEQGFREMVAEGPTRAALALKGALTQGHSREAILVDVREAVAALTIVRTEAEKARDAALERDAVALETQVQEARAQAQQLREQAAALDAQVATLTVEAAQARAEIDANFRSVSAYIDNKHGELVAIEKMFGGTP